MKIRPLLPALLLGALPCLAQDAPPAPPIVTLDSIPKVFPQTLPPLDKFTGKTGDKVPAFAVRPGYQVTLVAEGLGEARFLEFDDKGTLYLSQPDKKKGISALMDKNGDGVHESVTQFVANFQGAHGLDFQEGWLWFATATGVHKARDTNGDGVSDETVAVLPEGTLPRGNHWWKGLCVTPAGFYVSIGDSGDHNDEFATERQKIWFYSPDGKTRKLWSSGLRNTEKLQLRPGTNELWGSDHGSDNFGNAWGESKEKGAPFNDAHPPEEFNHYVEGAFYGHPFIVGNHVPRPEYLNRPDIIDLAARTTPPAWSYGAHWSGNGFTFLSKDYFPGHQGDVFAAFKGSSNSSVKVGYRIERLMFDKLTGRPIGSQLIVSTIGANGQQLDRPNDCVEAPDGSVIFSCDSGRIFRISKAN
ncbi:MAG TPA: PQQ-dependent sugar dehydrogenase [Abditibacteriaceae bacterium]